MPTKEITKLRQEGLLEDALAMAQSEYEKNPDGVWERRNLAWVYYSFYKKAAEHADWTTFLQYWNRQIDLGIISEEPILSNSSSWCLVKVFYAHIQNKEVQKNILSLLDEVFEMIKPLQFRKVTGTIASNTRGTAHFVRAGRSSYFIPPSVISKQEVPDGTDVTALIAMQFNKNKGEWEWKCVKIL